MQTAKNVSINQERYNNFKLKEKKWLIKLTTFTIVLKMEMKYTNTHLLQRTTFFYFLLDVFFNNKMIVLSST